MNSPLNLMRTRSVYCHCLVKSISSTEALHGFSGMNRFSQSPWSKVQCQMILAFLSFVDYFQPRYFLLENVRNLFSYNKGQMSRLTLASLRKMIYQVRLGVLEAGAYGFLNLAKEILYGQPHRKKFFPNGLSFSLGF
ncbi:hypothetical protein Bca4012_009937 [Brassica carinata]